MPKDTAVLPLFTGNPKRAKDYTAFTLAVITCGCRYLLIPYYSSIADIFGKSNHFKNFRLI
jgi:hypothetical protein